MTVLIFLVISVPLRFGYEHVKVPMPTLEICMEHSISTRKANPRMGVLIECKAEVKMDKP